MQVLLRQGSAELVRGTKLHVFEVAGEDASVVLVREIVGWIAVAVAEHTLCVAAVGLDEL